MRSRSSRLPMSLATRRRASARWRSRETSSARWVPLTTAPMASAATRPRSTSASLSAPGLSPTTRRTPHVPCTPGIATASSGRPSGSTAWSSASLPAPMRFAASGTRPVRPIPAACSTVRPSRPAVRGRSTRRTIRPSSAADCARGVSRSPQSSQIATRWWPYASRTVSAAAVRMSSCSSPELIRRESPAATSRSRRCRSTARGSGRAGSRSCRRVGASRATAAGSIVRRPPNVRVGTTGTPSAGPVWAAAMNRWRSPSR
jgi:hypothetical protein